MQITKLKLSNFRRFWDAEINFNPDISVLVGPNNSGKSTVLEAILGGLGAPVPRTGRYLTKTIDTGTCEIKTSFLLNDDEWQKAFALIRRLGEPKVAISAETLKKLVNAPLSMLWRMAYSNHRVTSGPQRTCTVEEGATVEGIPPEEWSLVQRAIDNLKQQNMANLFGIEHLSTDRRLRPNEDWLSYKRFVNIGSERYQYVRNRIYHLKRKNPKKYKELIEKVRSSFGFDDFEIRKDEDEGTVDLIIRQDETEYALSEMGGGTKSFVLLFSYLQLAPTSMVLIDEPDISLYPKLLTDLAQYLKQLSQNVQLILTSHHEEFINEFDVQHVFRVEYAEEVGSKVRKIESREDLARLFEHLGYSSTPYLRAEGTFSKVQVFTEGPTDEEYILDFAVKLGEAEEIKDLKPLFIPIEGSANRRRKVAPKILDKIWGRKAPFLLVLDRDEFSDAHIKKDVELFGENRIHYLSRREMENYLLDPSAITMCIKKRLGNSDTISKERVSSKLDELADGYRHEVKILKFLGRFTDKFFVPFTVMADFVKLCRGKSDEDIVAHLHSQFFEEAGKHSRDTLKETLSQETKKLENQWSSRRLSLCPGKKVLKELQHWVAQTFYITISGKEIISHIENVDEDIKELLDKIKRCAS